MRVLGLDPGSRRTGWGVVERHGSRYVAIDHGYVAASARLPLALKLHAIAKRIGEVVDAHAPDAVAVEEAFYHESVRSTLVLGHVRGALLVVAAERGVEVFEYTPRTVKLAVAGNGAASKEQVEYMVRRVLGVRGPLSQDAADGLAIAVCHLHRARSTPTQVAATAAAERLQALLARRAPARTSR